MFYFESVISILEQFPQNANFIQRCLDNVLHFLSFVDASDKGLFCQPAGKGPRKLHFPASKAPQVFGTELFENAGD